jgi:predicted DCC family thiol-disulfide oxidoreductase YuxK
MPPSIFAAAWIVMSAGYTYSGYTKLISPSWVEGTAIARVLANPLARPTFVRDLVMALPDSLLHVLTWVALAVELLYAPLALVRRVRPFLWVAMLSMHLGLMVLIDFAELSLGMVILHLFTFDPAWIRGRLPQTTSLVFYDGNCGLCHRICRFLVAEDRSSAAFQLAPLGGERFAATLDPGRKLPDGVVVVTSDSSVLLRSEAVVHILARLGGFWRVLAVLFALLPRRVRDASYDVVANTRYRVFGRTDTTCPVLPPDLRARFSA